MLAALAMAVPAAGQAPSLPGSGAERKGPVLNGCIVVLKDSVERPGRLAQRHSANREARIEQVYRDAIKGYAAKIGKGELAAIEADPTVAHVERDYFGGIASQTTPTGIDRIFATANEALQINEDQGTQQRRRRDPLGANRRNRLGDGQRRRAAL